MTTKAPSPVKRVTGDTLERAAYASVEGIPTREPHDLDRLGYNIWLWLKHRRDPLEIVVKTSCARLQIGEEEAVQRIRQKLQEQGIAL